MSWKGLIIDYVKDAEEYPSMEEFVEYFKLYKWNPLGMAAFIKALLIINDADIFYDSKHDSWLYTGGPIKGEFVKLSELPAKSEEDV